MNFRRWIIALAVLTLFTGVASAQFQTLASISCTVSASPSLTARSEGTTERVGDVLISCGNSTTAPTNGSAVDRGSLLVDFGVPVTSKTAANVASVGKPSEIVLMFDEPGSNNGPVAGYGQNAAINVCTAANAQADQAAIITGNSLTAAANCPATLYNVVNAVGSYWVLDSGAAVVPPAPFVAAGQAKNVYQGAVGGSTGIAFTANQVMFYDVPILPSGANNLTHLFRITNVRLTPGTATSITATFTQSPLSTTSVPATPITGARWQYAFSAPSVNVASVASGITSTVSTSGAVSLCTSSALVPGTTQAKANLALIKFTENFAGAFKTRTLALTNTAGDTMGSAAAIAAQIKPGGAYQLTAGTNSITLTTAMSESSVNIGTNGGVTNMGVSDSGTRLKAVFKSLDPNVQYYVSLQPVIDYATPATFPTNPLTGAAGAPGDATQTGWAVLQAAGTAGAAPAETAAYTPAVPLVTLANGTVPVAQITRAADGSGQATWEVTNNANGTPTSMTFAVYAVYNNIVNPPTATSTIQPGYAPTTSSTSTAQPRFAAISSSLTQNFFRVIQCQTALLFPYVTNVTGYETGIAISNTSKDPFNTTTSAGKCSLNFYGANQPTTAMDLWDPFVGTTATNIAAGTMIANTATNILNPVATTTPIVNFNGYVIAVCNFQYAHGFAFVQNSKQTLGMGYLPLVIDTSLNTVNPRGQTLLGEGLRP